MAGLAILSGRGSLPLALAAAYPEAVLITMEGVAHDHKGATISHCFDKLGALFADLESRGVTEIVFAGGMERPRLDPGKFDRFMQEVAPRLMSAFQQGDDFLLRFVISLFEEQGLQVRGAHELLEGLTAEQGVIAGPAPDAEALADATKAVEIMTALAPLDVGQGAVVASGLCIGIETLQGTDALLHFVAQTPPLLRRAKGVFVKLPKEGQDLRVDMPAIGPDTIENIAKAGLAGVVVAPGRVMILERARTCRLAAALGVFIYGEGSLS